MGRIGGGPNHIAIPEKTGGGGVVKRLVLEKQQEGKEKDLASLSFRS